MVRIGKLDPGRRVRYDDDKFVGWTDMLIDPPNGPGSGPQAFLVHQAPHWVLPTHFHLEEQFQVFCGGSGMLGRHALEPVSVHYTAPHTGYGPVVAGAEGLIYLTLRAVADSRAQYLPESRHVMRDGAPKRQWTVGPIPVCEWSGAETPSSSTRSLIAANERGGGAWLIECTGNQAAYAPGGADGGGRFHIVLAGKLQLGNTVAIATECVYTSKEEAPLHFCAGERGVELLVLQFPAPALLDAAPAHAEAHKGE
jgi:hypothetical protein